jgi:hypothetical protein
VGIARLGRGPDVTGVVVFGCLAVRGQELERNGEVCLMAREYGIWGVDVGFGGHKRGFGGAKEVY